MFISNANFEFVYEYHVTWKFIYEFIYEFRGPQLFLTKWIRMLIQENSPNSYANSKKIP